MSECILSRFKGYGIAKRADGTQTTAHRYVYEQAFGPIPKGMCVCHACDRSNCINLEHLWLGTYAENSRDMVRKRRHMENSGRVWTSAEVEKYIDERKHN